MDIYEARRTNLRRLMDATYGINARGAQTRMAERLNKSQNYLSRCLADPQASGFKKIGEQFAREIEAEFGLRRHSLDFDSFIEQQDRLPTNQFTTGEGSCRNAEAFDVGIDTGAQITSVPLPFDQGRVPVVGKAMLGMDGYFEALDYPVGHGDGYLAVPSRDPNAYALRVVGNSMTPRIKNGEFVLIEPGQTFANGDDVLVRTRDGRSMIKEFVYLRDGQYRFDSYGNGYEPIYLDEGQVEQIHFVGGIFKSYRFSPE